jgi:hypothetical protein
VARHEGGAFGGGFGGGGGGGDGLTSLMRMNALIVRRINERIYSQSPFDSVRKSTPRFISLVLLFSSFSEIKF